MIQITIITLICCLLFGVPIAFAIGIAGTAGLYFGSTAPMFMVVKQFFEGINSFSYMAIPLVILAGAIMGKGGIFTRAVGVVLGSVLFRLVYTIALRFDMPAFMLKLISSIIVVLAISIPYLKKQMPMIKRRMGIKTQKGGV